MNQTPHPDLLTYIDDDDIDAIDDATRAAMLPHLHQLECALTALHRFPALTHRIIADIAASMNDNTSDTANDPDCDDAAYLDAIALPPMID